MENTALLILLESVLNKGQKTSKGNYAFKCPFCLHHKNKLEINLITNDKKENPWHCWVCEVKGKTIKSLFKQARITQNKIEELNLIIVPGEKKNKEEQNKFISLPEEFISLSDINELSKFTKIKAKHALAFLKKRNIHYLDVIKYNIGFCVNGIYKDRIIIPSYDSTGKLNYFISRDYTNKLSRKYLNPSVDVESIIGLELYINWNAPIILVEGMLDALTIKRNVIPLFGKLIHKGLMKKIVNSSVDKIYIALDKDAKKNALEQAELLLSYNKEVYLVEMDIKDFNEMGFEKSLELLENTYPLTFSKLIELKLNKNE